jgi:hypothetical protein
MSQAPQTLVDLRIFLADAYDIEGKNFGIRGTCTERRPWGYHLGKADIFSDCGKKLKDYSLRYKRDRNGLTNSSAGFDIRLPQQKLRALVAYLVQQGKNGYAFGGKSLIVEVLGPDSTGEAKRWARDTNWLPRDARNDHEWHAHISFYRDTEFIDKRPLFAKHLGVNLAAPAGQDEDEALIPQGSEKKPVKDPKQPEIDEVTAQLADAEDALADIQAIAHGYFNVEPE